MRNTRRPASSDLSDLPAPQPGQCLSVDEAEVRRAVLSFPPGSAGGPDGLRPQHIRDMGLSLNVAKCELIAHTDLQIDDPLLQSFERVEISDATLLGAPLFQGPAFDMASDKRCEDLARAVDRLRAINSQDG